MKVFIGFIIIMIYHNCAYSQSIRYDSLTNKYLVDTSHPNGLIELIKQQLRAKGYDPGPECDLGGGHTRASLIRFQKDNGLEIGRLDNTTLAALGIETVIFLENLWTKPQLQKSIIQFQQDNCLRVGYLDEETMRALNIK